MYQSIKSPVITRSKSKQILTVSSNSKVHFKTYRKFLNKMSKSEKDLAAAVKQIDHLNAEMKRMSLEYQAQVNQLNLELNN